MSNQRLSNKSHRLKQSKKRHCPLFDPNIGIISENDHRVGLCLCRFCDCGEHTCSKNVNPNTKSTFNTKYMQDFQKSQFDVPLKNEPKLYRPNTAKMDFTTTNQIEYQKRIPTPEVSRSVSMTPYKGDLARVTAYSSDYPDWGPVQVSREKTWHPPVRSVDLGFQGDSSYKNTFKEFDKDQIDLYKTDISSLNAFHSKFSLAPKQRLSMQTTYSEKMKNYSENGLNGRVVVKATPLTPAPATNGHFTTTFQDSYKPSTPHCKDPRQLRYTFQKQTPRSRSVQV